MKKILLLFYMTFCLVFSSFSQAGTWTWISGSNLQGAGGIYGIQGVPSVNNHPPANYEMVEWKDKQGNLWLYGGTYPQYADLWMYSTATNEWTWVKGTGLSSVTQPVYGLQGVPDPSNTPGSVSYGGITWVDTSGDFWLFGGSLTTNDLWRYDISSNEWTWMNGNHSTYATHGTMGVPGFNNVPGTRCEDASSWTDSNNLWLYGGYGNDENGALGSLNDLMKYNIATNEWTWMKGSAYKGAPAAYGVKGTSNAANDPGARWSYTRWQDKQGKFWLFGGEAYGCANDVWNFDPGINDWTWMSGTNVPEDAGTYGANCVFDSTYNPASRKEQRSATTDNCGRFWMFGGFDDGDNVFNDLWLYDPQLLQWKLLSGSNTMNVAGDYGTLGVASLSNVPPCRFGANAWWGNDNKFYMFGGFQQDVYGTCQGDLWVFDPDTTCISFSCNAVNVLPPVAGFQSNKTSLCSNDCINFTDLSTNATSWQWTFAGAIDSTSNVQNPQSICYLTTGIYNVTLIAFNSGGSDTLVINNYITVNAAPPTPTITQVDTILYCSTDSSYTSYQWYADTTLIAGATDSSLVIKLGGNYNVRVSNANGCSIAVGINIILGVQNYMSDHVISLSPNPATDKLIIKNSELINGTVDIFNLLGQVCSHSEIVNRKSEIELDVWGLPSGIYFVQLIGEKELRTGRFVKE